VATSTIVLAEVTHRLMIAETVRAKLDAKDAEFIVKLAQEFILLAKKELEG
jgi:hypothetical protein